MSPAIEELDRDMAPLAGSDTPLRWYDPGHPPFRLAGLPWFEQDRVYRRLPLEPAEPIPEAVMHLATNPAGAQIAFRTDSRQVALRVELAAPAGMSHMPATGQCGFDLYLGGPGKQRFYNSCKYPPDQAGYELLLLDHPEREQREVTLNFPLYQGVKSVRVGLLPEAEVRPATAWTRTGRVIVYGTSITQGGCASRPGLAYTNILSRALGIEFVNLGFSGNGRGEPGVIRLLATVPAPLLFVLDYEANCSEHIGQTLPTALEILREHHPRIPILVVSRIAFARDSIHPPSLARREANRELQAQIVERARAAGDENTHFLDGSRLLGEDSHECTVDGVHPNDLGFMRMARGLEPMLRSLLGL